MTAGYERSWQTGAGATVVLLAVLISGGTVSARAVPTPDGRISVVGEATVDGEIVRLADVARLEGPLAAALADLEIGQAPVPGGMRSLSGANILGTLRRHGVDFERIRYLIPPVVRVHRRAQDVAASAIRTIVEEYVARDVAAGEDRITLKSVDVPGFVRLPLGPYEARVTPLQRSPVAGGIRLMVEFLHGEHVVGSVNTMARVAVFENVCVTRRTIPRGSIVSAADVFLERRDVSSLPRDVITREEDVVGKEAKVGISALTPLRHDQLDAPAVVHRGDIVTLLVESGALRITAKGEVREDAPFNAQARVWNLGSRKEVVGRVVDASTIAVTF